MALVYKEEYKNIAKIGGKEIHFKPWNTKNEKEFLIAVESDEDITDSMLYELLVKPCIKEQDIVLDEYEQKLLMIEMRKKSIGSTFPLSYKCSNCKNLNEIEVELDDIIKYNEPKYDEVTVEDITISFGVPRTEKLIKRLDEVDTKVEKTFYNFLIHINYIIIDGVKEDTFSFEELKDYIESLPTSIFDEFYEKYSAMSPNLRFELDQYCMFCNEKNQINLEGIPNFLWA